MPIQKGQEYLSCQPTYVSPVGPPQRTRIRVLRDPVTTPGVYGFDKVMVATVTSDGRLLRQRQISVNQLHETRLVGGGWWVAPEDRVFSGESTGDDR